MSDLHSVILTGRNDMYIIAAGALKIQATVIHVDAHFDLLHEPAGLKVESFVDAAWR